VRPNLFWKLALTFLALLLGVLVAVDFFAERALRSDYERTGFNQLIAIARIATRSSTPLSAPSSLSPRSRRPFPTRRRSRRYCGR